MLKELFKNGNYVEIKLVYQFLELTDEYDFWVNDMVANILRDSSFIRKDDKIFVNEDGVKHLALANFSIKCKKIRQYFIDAGERHNTEKEKLSTRVKELKIMDLKIEIYDLREKAYKIELGYITGNGDDIKEIEEEISALEQKLDRLEQNK